MDLQPEPRFTPSKKVSRIAGVIILIIAVAGLGVSLYLSFR